PAARPRAAPARPSARADRLHPGRPDRLPRRRDGDAARPRRPPGRAAERAPLGRRGRRRAGAEPRRLHPQARRVRGLRTNRTEGPKPMTQPNTLIFVDLASDDPAAAGKFYAEVFGWRDDERPRGVFHRMVPGGNFPNPDGSDSEIGNLHLGIFDAANARPHPTPEG